MDPVLSGLMAGLDIELLTTRSTDPKVQAASTAYRREACRNNPLLFAVLYLPKHIQDPYTGEISFSSAHVEWAELAKQWTKPGGNNVKENRHAFIAPRMLGKTTWWYLILPLWWAAYGYSEFTVAFAHSARQAEEHLRTLKDELDNNEALRDGFPELCALKPSRRGQPVGDSHDTRMCANGFIFKARGADAGVLGMKVGRMRPDTILLDDIEPNESNYSMGQKEDRLSTVQAAILPLNDTARVVLTGTTTMYGSMVHDLVMHAKEDAEPVEWVEFENFTVHHHKPFILNPDGTETSIWPGRKTFALDTMEKQRNNRIFKLNFENDPDALDTDYWKRDHFTYGTIPDAEIAGTYLSIDGAVTTTKKSDFTGIAVVACANAPKRALVRHAEQVKLKGSELREHVIGRLEEFPDINFILIETNQGGDLWKEVFHDMPVPILTVHNSVKKETRASRLLNLYQQSPTQVLHEKPLYKLEDQMCQFPTGANDDMVDAVGTAVLRWVVPEKRRKARMGIKYPT